MALIPEFLLKKLYIAGSLVNVDGGWQFSLKNTLAKATVISFKGLAVDGTDVSLDDVTVVLGNEEITAGAISPDNPKAFPINVPVTLKIAGPPLSQESHTFKLSLTTKEFGPIEFSVSDAL